MDGKKVILIQGGIRYELNALAGAWAKSYERIPLGTVRMIGGLLMYAWNIYERPNYFIPWSQVPEVNWSPVDKEVTHDQAQMSKFLREAGR